MIPDCVFCNLTAEVQEHPAGLQGDLDDMHVSSHFQHYIDMHGEPKTRDELFRMWAFALALRYSFVALRGV